jgi:fibronectin-binding autotransporter adhesin
MRLRSAIIAGGALFASVLTSHAQTSVWTATSGNWSTGSDWLSGSAPANDGSVTVNFGVILPSSSTLDVNYSVAAVNVLATAGNFTLLGSNTLTVGSAGFTDISIANVDIYPVLTGAMSLSETAVTGTLTLHAANTYTGNTNIASGIFADAVANAFSPNSLLQVGPLGIVDVNDNETVLGLNDLVTGGSVVVSSGATLTLNGGFSTTFSGVISGGGGLQQNGASTLTLTGANTYTGATTIGAGSGINLGGGGLTGSIASPTVTGSGSLSFDLTLPITYAGDLIGALNVVQQGTGTTTLSGANTYTGPTTINAGVLKAGSATAFGSNSAFTLNGTGSLNLNGFNDGIGSLSGGPSTTVLLGNKTLSITNIFAGAGIFNGTISGAGGSINMGGYVLDLTNNNTYTGGTTISAGTLEADNSGGSATGNGAITIMPGGVLQIGNGGGDTNGSINGGASITDNGNITFARSASTFPNTITGTGGITEIGSGDAVALTGNNGYSGSTTVQVGTLNANSTSALGNGLSDVNVIAGGTLNLNSSSAVVGSISGDSSGTIDTGSSSLTTGASNLTTTFAGQLQGSGHLIVVGTGTTILTGSSSFNGPITIPGSAGTLQIGDGVTTGAGLVNVNTITDAGTLTFAPALTDNITYNFNISGTGGLTVTGPGTITLRGNNSLSGLTSVTGGTLADGGGNAFSSNGGMLVDTAGTLQVNFNETVGNLQNGAGGGTVTIASGKSLTSLGMNYLADFEGAISGNGTFGVSNGVQGLSGDNTYSGGTLVSGNGELFVGSNTAVGTGTLTFNGAGTELSPDTNVTLANNIVLDSSLDNDDGASNSLTLTGQISGASNITWCTPGALTLTNNGNNFTGGVDMREGTLYADANNAAGTGVITLDTTSTLVVMNGVTVSNSLNFTGTAATLAGNGTIATPVTANSAVAISASASPGGGPGNLTFSNGLTLASGATINFNIYDANGTAGTGFNLITSTNGLNLTASPNTINLDVFTINGTGGAAPAINFNLANSYSWKFATSSSPITGFNVNQFNVNTAGFLNATAAGFFSVSGTTNDLVLNFTPVPEPSTWALMAAGAVAIAPFVLRRRRPAAV